MSWKTWFERREAAEQRRRSASRPKRKTISRRERIRREHQGSGENFLETRQLLKELARNARTASRVCVQSLNLPMQLPRNGVRFS